MVLNVEGIQARDLPIEIGSQLCDFGWIIMACCMLHAACYCIGRKERATTPLERAVVGLSHNTVQQLRSLK